MKSERRHELQTNVLADWLGQQVEAVKPYATQITIAVVVIAAVAAASFWYVSGADRATAKSWSAYFSAFNQREPEQALAGVMAKEPGSPAALWAAQSLGDMNLAQGATLLFSDRAEAEKRLATAEETLKQVHASATDPMLKARAQLSLGKLYEAKLQPEEAVKHYEMASQTAKNSAIAKEAAAHAKRMKDRRQVEMLAWFAQQTPKKPAPLPGMGGGLPGLPNDLPDRPDISLPGFGFDDIGTGTPAGPGLAFPPAGAPAPAGAAPDDAVPDDAVPLQPDDSVPDAPVPDAPATPPGDAPTTPTDSPPSPADPPTDPPAPPQPVDVPATTVDENR